MVARIGHSRAWITALLAALVAAPALAPAGGAAGSPIVPLASGGAAGPGWAAMRVLVPAGAAVYLDVAVTDARPPVAFSFQSLRADGALEFEWTILDLSDDAGAVVRADGTPLAPVRYQAPSIGELRSGYEAGFAIFNDGSSTLARTLVLWVAGDARGHAWTLKGVDGASVGGVTSGANSFLYRESDFAGVAAEANHVASADAMVGAQRGLAVSSSLFGVYFALNRDGACFAGVAYGCAPEKTAMVASWQGPADGRASAGELRETFAGAEPGAYVFRVDAALDAGARASSCPLMGALWACAGADALDVVLAGADVVLPPA